MYSNGHLRFRYGKNKLKNTQYSMLLKHSKTKYPSKYD